MALGVSGGRITGAASGEEYKIEYRNQSENRQSQSMRKNEGRQLA
jgi:hypothetical protein